MFSVHFCRGFDAKLCFILVVILLLDLYFPCAFCVCFLSHFAASLFFITRFVDLKFNYNMLLICMFSAIYFVYVFWWFYKRIWLEILLYFSIFFTSIYMIFHLLSTFCLYNFVITFYCNCCEWFFFVCSSVKQWKLLQKSEIFYRKLKTFTK